MKIFLVTIQFIPRLVFLLGIVGCATPGSQPVSNRTLPPDDNSFTKTLNIVITSEPPGVPVWSFEKISDEVKCTRQLGRTPLTIPLKFCDWQGARWFKGNELQPEPRYWDSKGTRCWKFNFYVGSDDCYGVWATTVLSFDYSGQHYRTMPSTQLVTVSDKNGFTIEGGKPTLWRYRAFSDGDSFSPPRACPVKVVEHGRRFAMKMAEVIDREDYFGAEELRLKRIEDLNALIARQDNSEDPMTTGIVGDVHLRLAKSEIDRMQHIVGLLDPALMTMRKQLVMKLQQGDVSAAYNLARAVAAMESKYLPQPRPLILPESPSSQSSMVQEQNSQEVVVQQKPYYGVSDLVEAIGAMRGSKLNPEAYRKAWGSAKLLDILGFVSTMNK